MALNLSLVLLEAGNKQWRELRYYYFKSFSKRWIDVDGEFNFIN